MNGLGALVQSEGVQSESPSSIGFTTFAHAHDLNNWTLLGRCEHMWPEQVKTCAQNTRAELYCYHSAWESVLHADATQMGKWYDP